MLSDRLVRYRRPVVVAGHLVLIPVAFLLAFALRFDFAIPREYFLMFLVSLPIVLAARMLAFFIFGLERGWWRHSGLSDLLDLIQAVTLSSLLAVGLLFFTGQLTGFPRSILVLDWILTIVVFGGLRFSVRVFREEWSLPWGRKKGKRTLMLGAGHAAERLIRQFRRDADGSAPRIIGLLDDDASKVGMTLHGVRVLGRIEDLPHIAQALLPELLVIAVPSASRAEVKRIVDFCIGTGIEFKIVPSLRELVEGTARLGQLRNVEIEDLLGRPSVQLDLSPVESELAGRVVMVTGGAGSIGAELARQVARFNPRRLVLVEQAESPLYFIHHELSATFPDVDVVPVVGDITSSGRMEEVFRQHRPAVIFHAAAYKHVPLMEENVTEAVVNNVFGTLSVAQAAARAGAQRFILISTDKAVNPSSVMGATKRLAERIVLGWPSLRASDTEFRAVRFGNVLGSEGSVIPLFKRQLAAGKALTVTHPDVTRYFMTIPEAVQLVLQASALPESAGRVSMLEMGEPMRIVEVAENLIRLSGLEPYRDVPIVFTGLRPGEKLHEELMGQMETSVETALDKIRLVQTEESCDTSLIEGLDRLAAAVALHDTVDILATICHLVPESVPPLRDRGTSSERHTRIAS